MFFTSVNGAYSSNLYSYLIVVSCLKAAAPQTTETQVVACNVNKIQFANCAQLGFCVGAETTG